MRERAEYQSSLNSAMLAVKKQLDEIIRKNFSTKPREDFALFYVFNEKRITIAELLYFIGATEVLLYAAHCRVAVHSSEFWMGAEKVKADIIFLENFLKEVPGAVVPPRPERVDAWLKEEPGEKKDE